MLQGTILSYGKNTRRLSHKEISLFEVIIGSVTFLHRPTIVCLGKLKRQTFLNLLYLKGFLIKIEDFVESLSPFQ